MNAEHRLGQRCPAGSDQTGKTQDLTTPHGQGNFLLRESRRDEVLELQTAGPDADLGRDVEGLQVSADHEPDHGAAA